jgi:hypothetical protein
LPGTEAEQPQHEREPDLGAVEADQVYRKELRPVLSRGATAMNTLFGGRRTGGSDQQFG